MPASNAADSVDRLLKESPLCMIPYLHGDATAALKKYLYQRTLHSMVSLPSTMSQMMSSGSVVAKACWKSLGHSDCSLCCGIKSFWSPLDGQHLGAEGQILGLIVPQIVQCNQKLLWNPHDFFFPVAHPPVFVYKTRISKYWGPMSMASQVL